MADQHSFFVYVGTYTRGDSERGKAEGLYVHRLLPAIGTLQPIGVVPGIANPTFLAIAPNHKHLYAANEISNYAGKPSGAVCAFSIDPRTGMLSLLNQQATQGSGACHISIDRTGTWALVANYHGGSVSGLPILEDGRLGEPAAFVQHSGASHVDPQRQEAAHAHSIIMDPSNRYALVADLGTDRIMIYRLDGQRGTLTAHNPPFIASRPGAGPRHQVFHPSARFYYVVNELDSTVSVLRWDVEKAVGREIQVISTLPQGFAGESWCAEIRIAPSGRFVYASNRGHDSIAIFAVHEKTGMLTAAGQVSTQGNWPRGFELTPAGDLLLAANEHSDSIATYRINQSTGQLTPTGHVTDVLTPVCIRVLAAQ
jgi:6-phosphogluconolactonase